MNNRSASRIGTSAPFTLTARGEVGYFGVEGLDDLVPQGVSFDNQIMVEGDTGVGKSVLAGQFLYEGLVVGDHCVYIACDEPPDLMRRNMANFRLGTAAYERTGQLVFVDAYSREQSTERYSIPDPNNLDEFFLYEMRILEAAQGKRTRLVVDSLSTVVMMAEPAEIVEFNSNRLRYLRRANILTLDNFVSGTLDEQVLNRLRHAYPIILSLRYVTSNGNLLRFLQFGKLKSGQFAAEQFQFTIDPRIGIVMLPRAT